MLKAVCDLCGEENNDSPQGTIILQVGNQEPVKVTELHLECGYKVERFISKMRDKAGLD